MRGHDDLTGFCRSSAKAVTVLRSRVILGCAALIALGTTCSDSTAPRVPSFMQAVTSTVQEAVAGTAVANPPGVVVRDQDDNPMQGISVSFAITSGDGSLSPQSVTTGADGVARLSSWTLGSVPGPNTLTASGGGLPVVAFSATGLQPPPVATTVVALSDTIQVGTAGTAVGTPPAVLIHDQYDNPLAGVSVSFAAVTGGGSVTPNTVPTDADGVAQLTSWTLGPDPGANTVTATVGSLPEVVFTATAVTGGSAPAVVEAVTPVSQNGLVGAPVAEAPGVLVKDLNGAPLGGISVSFTIESGGGSIAPQSVVTGADGVARATTWTLGATPGLNSVSATVEGLPPVSFAATAAVAAGVPASLQPVPGASQQAPVGSPVAEPPAVLVLDADKIPVPGVAVTFVVTAGGGAVSPSVVTSDVGGVARLTSWTLGPQEGLNSLTASVGELAPVSFSATGLAPTSIEAVTPVVQSAPTNSPVADPPGVRVKDQNDNPLAGVTVAFAVGIGGGTVIPASVVTGSDGVAQLTSWTLGAVPGSNTVTATVPGLPTVTFAATGSGSAAVPASLEVLSSANQQGPVGSPVPDPPAVIVRDQSSNPLGGITVAFAVTAGGGAVSPATVVTGSDGIAELTSWTLGSSPGANTVSASVTGLTPVSFSATGLAPSVVLAVTPTSQQATTGSTVPAPPGVSVRDQNNNPVQGVAVNFAVTSGGGSVTPATVVTGSNGEATLSSWTVGPSPGVNTVTATVSGLPPVAFSANAIAPPSVQPASVQAITATSQQAPAGSAVAEAPGVIVRDQSNAPIAGVTVGFTVTAGGGTGSPANVVTGANGEARLTHWTLGNTPGSNTVSASVAGLQPVVFSATGVLVAAAVEAVSAEAQHTPVGRAVDEPPAARVRDQFGATMTGVTIAFAVTSGGGSVTPDERFTDGAGIAAATSWIVGNSAGSNTVTATAGDAPPVIFSSTAYVPSPTTMARMPGMPEPQMAPGGADVPTPPGVIVHDQNGRPMQGVTVSFAVTTGQGTVQPASRQTNSEGIAQADSWTLGSTGPATQVVTATASGLPEVTFSASRSASAPVATSVAAASVTNQTAPAGADVAEPPAVIVRDQNAEPMSGVGVMFAVTSGGGSLAPATETTGVDGIARVTRWTLGSSAGTNTLTASVGLLTPVTFTASGTLVAASISAATVVTQQAPAGTAVTAPPGVLVRDQNNAPLAGVSVTFAVVAGGGSVTPAVALTDANGVAQLSNWTLGAIPGTNTVTATAAGLPAISFNATGIAVPNSVQANTPVDQTAPAGSPVPVAPGVIVRDQNGDPMQGVSVAFAVVSGGGTIMPTTVVTGASGVAQLTSWTLGSGAGANSVTASVTGLPSVTFSATGTLVATAVHASTTTSQQALAGGPVASPPGVLVRDQNNNPMQGVTVAFAVTAGGGSVSPATVVSGVDGVAQLASWTLGAAGGTNTVTATVTGLPAVSFNAIGLAAATIQPVTAVSQEAPAGSAVGTPPGVIVRDQNSNPLAGVSVAFAVTAGGGAVAPATVVTGADGIARLTSWTLGTTPGTNTATATVGGLSPVVFDATGILVPTTVQATTSVSQQARVGSAVPQPPGVRVRDQLNNPMPGVSVAFAVTAGGGTVTPAVVVTGSDGVAQATSWTLGPSAGTNTVTATVSGIAPVVFTAVGLAPTSIQAVTATTQQAPAGGSVSDPPGVRVRDQLNNPLSGVTVNYSVTAGGGLVTPASVITGADGIARLLGWTLGPNPGTNTVTATVSGLTPVTFTATGTLVPTFVQAVTPTSQEAPIGGNVPQPPGVSVRDQNNALMPGVSVAFAVTSGGGSVSPAAVTTNSSGVATLSSWTLGSSAGTNTVSATVTGVAPVTFIATGVLVPASVQASTPTSQQAPAGSPVPTPPAVVVRAQNNALLSGVAVVFAVTAGNGTVTPSVRMTGADGVAQLSNWTLGSATGTNTVSATVTGLTPVAFTATGTIAPVTVVATTVTSQQGTAGSAVSERPAVLVRDQNNNPVQGVNVAFAVTGGGGAVSPANVSTGANGVAQLTSWTLGAVPGTNTVTATVSGLPSVLFTAQGVGAASVQSVTATSQSARVGTAVTAPPGVRVRDQNNNPLPGVTVSFAVTAGGGSISHTAIVSGADGIARLTSWILGAAPGANGVSAAVSGLTPVLFSATGLAPTSLQAFSSTSQQAPAGSPVEQPPAVVVRDQNGNPLQGVTVAFSVTGGGGSVANASAVSGSNGLASSSSWILGSVAGTNTVTATVAGLASVGFSATGLAPSTPPTAIEPLTAVNQEAPAGTTVAEAPRVRVRNAGGDPVAGVTVTFTITAGGGVASPNLVVTDAEGIAATLGWRLGTTPGANSLTAAVTGVPSIVFTATGSGSGPVPSSLQPITSTSQQAPAGTAVSSPPGVLVRDQNGNLMPDVNVTFSVTSGGGSVAPSVVQTGANGAAFATSWTLGSAGGSNTVTATVAGLPPVAFNATGTLVPGSVEAVTSTSQQGLAGANPPQLPRVRVRDQNNNPLAGVTVTFAVTSGGGSVSPLSVSTSGDGTGQLTSWTLGFTPGTNTVAATVTGLPPVTFTAIGNLAPTTITAVTSTVQQAPAGAVVTEPPGVLVRDQLNNPMPGVVVTFAITGGAGSLTPASRTTGTDGIARLTSWTLGAGAGTNSVTATVSGLPPVAFTATGVLVPSFVQAITATNQQLSVGAEVPFPPGVLVRDQNNNPMQGVSVAFAVTAGGGSLTPVSRTTGADGVARLTTWTVGATAGTNTLTATVTGLPAITFTATTFLPVSIQATSPTNQEAPANSAVTPPRVFVRDQNGNPLFGVNVTFTVTAGGGAIVPSVVMTGLDGTAQLVSWRLGVTPGVNTVTAAAPGLTPVTFTATGVVAPCPDPAAISLGTTINTTLGSTGCLLSSGEFVEFYSFSVTQNTTVRITESSSAVDPYLLLLRSSGKPLGENDDAVLGSLDAEVLAFLLPGTYIIGASSYSVGEVGPITVRAEQTSSDVTGCRQFFTPRGITTSQSLSTADCLSEMGNFRTDYYGIFLDANETVTITMNSTAVNPYLILLDANNNLIENGTTSGTSAQIVYTSPTARFYSFGATSAKGSQTGNYTLSVQ